MLAGAAKLYHAAHTRRVPRRVCTASGKVATEFQSDSSRTDSPVRILHAQPRSRVSVARLSRSWALRAAPFALTGAEPSGLGGHPAGGSRPKRKVPLRCRLCRNERFRRSGASFWWAQVRPEAPIRLIARRGAGVVAFDLAPLVFDHGGPELGSPSASRLTSARKLGLLA